MDGRGALREGAEAAGAGGGTEGKDDAPADAGPAAAARGETRRRAACALAAAARLARERHNVFACAVDAAVAEAHAGCAARVRETKALRGAFVESRIPRALVHAVAAVDGQRRVRDAELRQRAAGVALAQARARAEAGTSALVALARREVSQSYASVQALAPNSDVWQRVATVVNLAVPAKDATARVLAIARVTFNDGEAHAADAAGVPWSPKRHYDSALARHGSACKERGLFVHAPPTAVERMLFFGLHSDAHVAAASKRVLLKTTTKTARVHGVLHRLVSTAPPTPAPATLHSSWRGGAAGGAFVQRCAAAEARVLCMLRGSVTPRANPRVTSELARYSEVAERIIADADAVPEPDGEEGAPTLRLATSGNWNGDGDGYSDDGALPPIYHVLLCRVLTPVADEQSDAVSVAEPERVVPEFLVSLFASHLPADVSDAAAAALAAAPSATASPPPKLTPSRSQISANGSPTNRRNARPASGRGKSGSTSIRRATPCPQPATPPPPSPLPPAEAARAASAAALHIARTQAGPDELAEAFAACDQAHAEAAIADAERRVEVARATLAAAASASDAEVDSSEALANDVRWALDTFVGTPS